MAVTLGPVGELIADEPDAKVRATLKGIEIAKLGPQDRQNIKFSGADFDIEVVSMNAIEGGVEVFARAWDTNGQIGFGKDGSVDIERFRIFNPPIFVPDGTQTLTEDRLGNPLLVNNYQEDVLLATIQSLVHTIFVKKEKRDSKNIEVGKVGNTTSTFYSDSGNGRVLNSGAVWATVRGATDGTQVIDGSSGASDTIQPNDISLGTYYLMRTFFFFDTSALPDGDTISSATLSLYAGTTKSNGDSFSWCIVQSTPATSATLVVGDFDQVGTTEGASRLAEASVTDSAYNDFALNATGLGWIDKGGWTNFGFRGSLDLDNSAPTGRNYHQWYWTPDAGPSSEDPKLVVEHTVPVRSERSPGAAAYYGAYSY